MRPTAGSERRAVAWSSGTHAARVGEPRSRAPRAAGDLLDALARVAGRATALDIERCRRALEPTLEAFNRGEDPTHEDSPTESADEAALGYGRLLLARSVRDALRRLARRSDVPLRNQRTCRLVDAQLLVYHALAAAGLARVDEPLGPGGPTRTAARTPGTVFWVTGLSGAGKTTLATAIVTRLRRHGSRPSLLDGDDLRTPIAGPTGAAGSPTEFALASRHRLALQYAELACLTAAAGYDAVCATVSAFEDVRAENRRRITRYVEVWVDAPMDVLGARDPKGLYARARRGEVTNVVGVDLPFEAPADADHVVHNVGGRQEICQSARAIVDEWRASTPADRHVGGDDP